MSTLTVRLPESLHGKIRELAKAEGFSMNQFLVMAAAEKTSAILTESWLEEEARRGDRAAFDRVMAAVPDQPAEDFDRLPD